MSYIVRDKDGVMKAKLDNRVALEVINTFKGYFRDAKFKGNKKPKKIFVLEGDFVLGSNTPVRLYFWAGDKLIPED
jgi:hypothetical protein